MDEPRVGIGGIDPLAGFDHEHLRHTEEEHAGLGHDRLQLFRGDLGLELKEAQVSNHGEVSSLAGSGRLGFPVQHALFPGVAEGSEQDGGKDEGKGEDGRPKGGEVVLIHDGPGVEEDDFDVEKHEQHRHDVEFHAEPRLGIPDGQHAALIGAVFDHIPFGGLPEQSRGDEGDDREPGGDDQLKQDGKVVFQHGASG